MTDRVLLCLSGDASDAARVFARGGSDAAVILVEPSALRRLDIPRTGELAIAGGPPADEIGYGLSLLAVAAARPRRVTLVDVRRRRLRSRSVSRHLAAEVPRAGAQIAASAAALLLQRALASVPLAAPRRCSTSALARVLYIRPMVGTSALVGGSVTHAHEVVRALRRLGLDTQLWTTDRWIVEAAADDPELPHWQLVRVPRSLKAIPASAALGADLALARRALPAARRSDLIYQRHARFSLVGPLLARLARKPLFLEYNGPEAFFSERWQPTPLAGRLAACEAAALRAATRVLVVSTVDRDSLLERGVCPERIVVNPNAVDTRRFMRGGGGEVRQRLGFEREHVVIGFVGSFGRWHGAPVLAQAFARIAEALPSARLLLVGTGEEQETVRQTIAHAGHEAKAVFAGIVPSAEVDRYLDACDVLASPHVQLPGGVRFFGSPTKLYEYMAAGKAIVASRLEQIGEVLDHERSALLVEPGDVEGLAVAVLRLAHDPELRTRLGAEARRDAMERHTWRANAERIVRAYEELPAG